jgi:hypothetical protein
MNRNSIIIIIFNLRTAPFKAYCAIWVRRSNFRHQACHHATAHSGGRCNCGREMFENFAQNADFHVTFRDLLHAVKLRRIYFPSEGRRAEDFFALRIRRLRPGANPRTWVPKASTLPLNHRSRLTAIVSTL